MIEYSYQDITAHFERICNDRDIAEWFFYNCHRHRLNFATSVAHGAPTFIVSQLEERADGRKDPKTEWVVSSTESPFDAIRKARTHMVKHGLIRGP